MITRSLALRHGRSAIPRPSNTTAIRQWRRALSITNRKAAQEDTQQQPYDSISADWEFFQHQRKETGNVGAKVARRYKPSDLIKNPPRPEDITLELLLAAQTHLGHRTSLWHPANARYIFGTWGQMHEAIHVISLDVTAAHLRRACKIVSGVAAKGGVILFVGTRDGHALPVVTAASLAGGCHLFDKWTPGTLTNAQQILGKCAKKVVNHLDEEIPGFESQLRQRAAIKPDLVVCLNPLENYILLHECGMHNIPTIGIIDTDVNPTWVTYPIPANDDSLRSVSTIAGALGKAGEAGRNLRLERARAGINDCAPAQGLRMPTKAEMQASKRLKDHLAVDDRDDEEEDALTPQEQALFEEDSSADVDELDQIPAESDEKLASLTGYADDKNMDQQLTENEMELIADSVQRSEQKNNEAKLQGRPITSIEAESATNTEEIDAVSLDSVVAKNVASHTPDSAVVEEIDTHSPSNASSESSTADLLESTSNEYQRREFGAFQGADVAPTFAEESDYQAQPSQEEDDSTPDFNDEQLAAAINEEAESAERAYLARIQAAKQQASTEKTTTSESSTMESSKGEGLQGTAASPAGQETREQSQSPTDEEQQGSDAKKSDKV